MIKFSAQISGYLFDLPAPLRIMFGHLLLLLLCSQVLVGYIFGWGSAPFVNKHLIELKDNSIESTFEQAQYSLIYFYENHCQYCAHFNPTFELASTLLNNVSIVGDIQLVRANGKVNQRLNLLFSVQHYPTLKLLDYKTMKITTYNERERELDTIIDFLETNTNRKVYPNYDNLQSSITVLGSEVIDLSNSVVVFTMGFLPEWTNYKLPSHFYQELARRNKHIKFVLVDLGQFDVNSLVKEYQISNFPSMMYFSSKGFKTFRTHSQNHLENGNLDETDIKLFLENKDSDTEGQWFKTVEDLKKTLEESTFDGHKNVRAGFNFKHGDQTDEVIDIDDEYSSLIDHIEL